MQNSEQNEEPDLGPPPQSQSLAPVSQTERIVSLDVLRGIALLGILIANMPHFSQPLEIYGFRSGLWLTWMDRVADWISCFLIDGKFYPLFAILFGLGFSIQMERAAARSLDVKAVYRRRLWILMALGLAHGIFLWDGDVLFSYAVGGFGLLLFRNCKSRTIAIWAVLINILPTLLILLLGFMISGFLDHPAIAEIFQDFSVDAETKRKLAQAYVTGGYVDAVFYRFGEIGIILFTMLIVAPLNLGLFLIGMLAGRTGFFSRVAEYRRVFIKTLIICGAVGLVGNVFGAWVTMGAYSEENFGNSLTGYGVISFFGPVLTVAYIAAVLLLIHHKPDLTIWRPFAAAGQMALTNYLGQSLIATTIFYGYGFGLAGEVGRLGTIGIALLMFTAQVFLSMIWLKYFRIGPMEWLWRSLTYGKRQAIRRER